MSPRVYTRKFDHDEAARLRAAGWTWLAIAKRFGVTPGAVRYAVLPHVRLQNAASRARFQTSGDCCECGAPCSHRSRGPDRCAACAYAAQVINVRPATLRCITCRRWLPDDRFPSDKTNPARRGRHGQCTACQTAARRDYRARNREADRAYQRAYRRRRERSTA